MRLNREIFRLAIPSIVANITIPIVGMVAIAVVGQFFTEQVHVSVSVVWCPLADTHIYHQWQA